MIRHITSILKKARQDEVDWQHIFSSATDMSEKADVSPLEAPRQCKRQAHRNNVPASTANEYFKRVVYLPFLDNLLQQFNLRFGNLSQQAIQGVNLLPSHVENIDAVTAAAVLNYYRDDLQIPSGFEHELKLW